MSGFLTGPVFRGAYRTLASLLIAAAFLTVLMVASAQQQVMQSLKASGADKMSYSSARQLVQSVVDMHKQQRDIHADIARLDTRNRQIDDLLPPADSQLSNTKNEIIVINDRLARAGLCGLAVVPDTYSSREVWFAIAGCRSDPKMPAETRKAIDLLDDRATGFIAQYDKVELFKEEKRRNIETVAADRAQIASIAVDIKQATPVIESFRDIDFVNESTIMSATGLTSFPPALMQIILTFLSGLFGALLLTIILAVYPNSKFQFTQTNSYWSRILLGGLIAVAVFVVIGGGVTVLGSNKALFEGDANFMSFCAIGMLAGMFSDRVAQWLSARADMFVDTSAAAAAAAAGAEGLPHAKPSVSR